jgi:hypothetical protein
VKSEHDQLAELAEALVGAAIATDLRIIRQQLANLEPLEAMVLLGKLADETIKRFPADDRAEIRDAWLSAFVADDDE